ncbi:Pimeloyl-ACP methyl ester carboxylesterase [Microlunatus sagamiharensis]|uniref:Pimeloyl-ACP methyl ester carboxylesterase n=1 Tax=Microlunatus sagamiharensis TaxID=546874 RepID=A0A1H2LJY0_9ACTN|nr:alpha/beta fold hydrolase [Microlunatus sagamiharensis]SDU81045.1 Pimeloyl-ACP methyl ester carboxylesterase [Microlunatus sagamiharensis]
MSAGSSEPLVLLPGSGCTAALWSRLTLDGEVLTPVLREPTLDGEVDRLLAALPERFALAGLSLGAIVAMALVRRAPERVSRLCLMSTNPYAPTPAQHEAWAAQRAVLADVGAVGLQESLLPLLRSPGRTDLDAEIVGMAEELGPETYAAQCRLQDTRVDERPGLVQVRCPTLVVAARDDRLCPLERHEEISRLVPGAELVVLDDCAHLSPLEQPEAVSGLLRRWLAGAAGENAP